ncbi:style cell-cycle inhibitor 1-B [Salvia miltiorrhiza]|uniref:style cell-cycle inhibitor 1-B n=1 Tax=Salvia miltiorrhiza TaxID=226208 RepID=UPI0025AB9528|nr:style cell-cycle inhibitor 1-B [Salvia miltiorrhiza]
MGKSKDDRKLKRSSSSPRDESRSRKRRSKDDDDDKEHKSSKKHKSHSSSKHHSRKEDKSSGKRKHKGHKHDKLPKLDIQELSDEDYFSKNNEFATWLKEEKKMFFSDLSSDAARSLFSEFVAEWNNQQLQPQYYQGIATAPRTSHKWNIKN